MSTAIDPEDWTDHHLTTADAVAIGGSAVKGDTAAWSSLIRFPPAVQQLRREMAEQHAEVMKAIAALKPPAE